MMDNLSNDNEQPNQFEPSLMDSGGNTNKRNEKSMDQSQIGVDNVVN